MDTENNHFLCTSFDNLSTRAQNIVNDLGGEEIMLNYYIENQTFLKLRNAGVFVENELTSYCKYLIDQQRIKSNHLNLITDSSEEEKTNQLNFESLNLYYQKCKLKLGTRSQKVLLQLEKYNDFNSDTEHSESFINRYFLENFNFLKIRNIGAKSAKELFNIGNELKNYIKTNRKTDQKETQLDLLKKIVLHFNLSIDTSALQTLTHENKFSAGKTICALIKCLKLSDRKKKIVDFSYFETKTYTLHEISQIIGCSRELVRSHLANIESNTIKKIYELLKDIIPTFSLEHEVYYNLQYFSIPAIKEFEFNGQVIKPNQSLSKYVFKLIFLEKFTIIDELINELPKHNKSFTNPEQCIFVDHSFLEETRFRSLIQFLNVEIYNFESVGFEYNMEILINRFYKENNYQIPRNQEQEIIYNIIKNVKTLSILIKKNKIRKIDKIEKNNRIISITEDLLKDKIVSLKTQDILLNLRANGIEIETEQLLNKLGKESNLFIRLGNGLWGLKEVQENNDLHGSLRTIVKNILIKRSEPIHISELHDILNKMRPTTIQSIYSNLRATNDNTFQFFNCSFIGIHLKPYDQLWNNIPKLNPAFLKSELSKLKNNINNPEIVEIMHSKYGYPKIHIEYLIKNRQNIKK